MKNVQFVPQCALWEKPKYPRHNLRGKRYRETYETLLEKQEGLCFICHRAEHSVRQRKLFIDHCHVTGKIRGLLCNPCNSMLGMLENYGCDDFNNRLPFEILNIRAVRYENGELTGSMMVSSQEDYHEFYVRIEYWLKKHKEDVLLYLEEVPSS